MKGSRETKKATLAWFLVVMGVTSGWNYRQGGEIQALAFLEACWGFFGVWALVNAFLIGLVVLAAILGSPLKPWEWFK